MQNRLSSTGVADCGTVVWREDTCFVSCKRILLAGLSACDGSLWRHDSVFPAHLDNHTIHNRNEVYDGTICIQK